MIPNKQNKSLIVNFSRSTEMQNEATQMEEDKELISHCHCIVLKILGTQMDLP